MSSKPTGAGSLTFSGASGAILASSLGVAGWDEAMGHGRSPMNGLEPPISPGVSMEYAVSVRFRVPEIVRDFSSTSTVEYFLQENHEIVLPSRENHLDECSPFSSFVKGSSVHGVVTVIWPLREMEASQHEGIERHLSAGTMPAVHCIQWVKICPNRLGENCCAH